MEPHERRRALVSLAERIERDTRGGQPVGRLLDELHDELVALTRRPTSSPSAVSAARRMCEIVTQLAQDADGGKVRSISGLTAHARNLVAELERGEAERGDARGYALT